jgi:dihydrofolate reductase
LGGKMTRFRVNAFGISMDGFGAGAEQSLDNPMGVGGLAMHGWAFETKTFRAMHGGEGGGTGIDDEFAVRSFETVGAWILGRNMFGPVRGSWGDESWKGGWGAEPA